MSVYFITGGGGFVGSRLCDYILENEIDSTCVLVDIGFADTHYYASSVKTRDAVDKLRGERVERRVVDITDASGEFVVKVCGLIIILHSLLTSTSPCVAYPLTEGVHARAPCSDQVL